MILRVKSVTEQFLASLKYETTAVISYTSLILHKEEFRDPSGYRRSSFYKMLPDKMMEKEMVPFTTHSLSGII